MESQVVLVPPDQARRARDIQLFYAYGCPGMTLLAEPAPPPVPKVKPLVKRCGRGTPPCQRQISKNKTACKFCHHINLMVMAEKIETREVLDKLIAALDPAEQAEALANITPYLKF